MVCSINNIPNYINSMNIGNDTKIVARNIHNSIVNELMGLTDSKGNDIFVNRPLMEYDVTIVNPNINQEKAIKIAENKIKELNKKYFNSVKLLDSAGRKVLAVNVTSFSEAVNKTKNPDIEMLDADTSREFNLDAHVDQVRRESIKSNIYTFLKRLGVTVEQVNDLEVNGKNPKAVADLSKKLIQYVVGEEDKLAEEAAHFLTMLLPADHPIMVEAMAQIVNHPIYAKVVEEYGGFENYNEEKLKHEAIGQLVANRVKEYKGEVNKIDNSTWIGRLINNALNWIKNLFANKNVQQDDVFDNLAYRLLNADISDLSFDNIQDSVMADGIFFNTRFQQIVDNLEKNGKKDQIYERIKQMYSNISALKSQVKKAEGVSKEKIDKTLEFLKSSINKMENVSLNTVNTFVDLVYHTEAILEDFKNEINGIELITDPNAKLLRVNNLHLSTRLLTENIIPEIRKVSRLLSPEDELYKKMASALASAGIIQDFIQETYLELCLDIFPARLKDKYEALKAEYDERIQGFEKNLEQAKKQNDKKRVKLLEGKIQKEKETFRKLAPSQENIENLLTGIGGDASAMSRLLEAAAVNGNVLISELSNIIQQAVLSRHDRLQKVLNESQNAIDKFATATGRSKNSPDEFYKNIIETVKVFDGFDEEGNPKVRYQKALVSEHNKAYIYELQLLVAKIVQKNKERFVEKDPAKAEQLGKEIVELLKEKSKFEKENMELEFTDDYYKIQNILDVDLGNGVTARSKTKDIYEVINTLKDSLRYAVDPMYISMVYEQLDENYALLRDLKNEKNKTGIDLKVAQQLNKYSEEMAKAASWELTKDGEAKHAKYLLDLKSQLDNGLISKETYDILYDRAFKEEFSKEYYIEKKNLSKELDDLLEEYKPEFKGQNKMIDDELSKAWDEIFELSKLYRDDDNVINGNRVPEEKAAKIKEIELKIESLRKNLLGFSGLSKADRDRKDEIYRLLEEEEDDAVRSELKDELYDISQKQEQFEANEEFVDKVNEIFERMRELTESVETEYYKELLEAKLSEIEVGDYDTRLGFTHEEETYYYNGVNWVSQVMDPFGQEQTLETEQVNSIYKDRERRRELEQTEWFQKNHILKERFNGDPENPGTESYFQPIYIWRRSKPADESMIKKVPAFQFMERVIDPKYKNANYRSTIDGYNVPKKGKFVNDTYFKLSAPEKEFLKYITDLYINTQEAYIPLGKRNGLFLPSIEKSSFEKIGEFSITELGKNIKSSYEGAKRRLFNNEQDSEKMHGSFSDDILGDMPVLFSGRIEDKDQTSNALDAVLTYVGYAARYDALKEVKPIADALSNVVSDPKNKPHTQNWVNKMANFKNRLLLRDTDRVKGEPVIQQHVNDLIRTWFYHETEYDVSWGNFNIGKTVNHIMSFAATTTLGGHVLSNVKNNVAGKIQMGLAATLLRDKVYNHSDLAYGQMKSFSIIKDLVSDNLKAGNITFYHQLINKVDGFQGSFLNEYGQKISASLLKEAANFKKYFMLGKNTAEIEMQIVNAMAVLNHIKIEHEGKLIPLHQAFELKDGLIAGKNGINTDMLQKKVIEATEKLKYANIVTNGNYNKMDSVTAEKYALGRIFLFMNKYFVPMAAFRFQKSRYNVLTNEISTGFQRSFLISAWNDVRAGYFPFAHMLTTPEDYTQEEKLGALTTAQELGTLILLALMFSLAGGEAPDKYKKLKEDPNGYWKSQMLNLILSIKLETETMHPFYGSDNIAQKVKSPFPIARLIENIAKLIHTLDAGDEDFYKRNSGIYEKGDYKGIAYALKILGLESALLEYADPIEYLKRREQSQFIRQ